MHHDDHDHDDQEYRDHLDDRQQTVAPTAPDVCKELGAARKAECKNKQGKCNVFQIWRDTCTRLTEQQRDDQRSANAPELNGSEFERADEISDGQAQEQSDLRLRPE